jgi:hypothetical protein
MLKADWLAAAQGEIYPTLYPAGTILTGELLDRARAAGLIEEAEPAKVDQPMATRARRRSPETK